MYEVHTVMSAYVLGLLAYALTLVGPGYHGEQLTRPEVHALVAEHSDWNVEAMTSIAMCESNGYIGALSNTEDAGLLQVHSVHWTGTADKFMLLTSPRYAVARAHDVWAMQGRRAWTCAKGVR